MNYLTKELKGLVEDAKVEIHIDLLKSTQKISNWKAPGYDGIHSFMLKKFTSIHDRRARERRIFLQGALVPEWMTKRRTILIQNAPNNYRPITCLPMRWKIWTAQIREEIYCTLINSGLFPDEQKRCCKGCADVSKTVAMALSCQGCADVSVTVVKALPFQSCAVSSKQARMPRLRLAVS